MFYFLYAWFTHVVCILQQVNKDIVGRHEAHGRFSLHWYNASTTYQLVTVIQER